MQGWWGVHASLLVSESQSRERDGGLTAESETLPASWFSAHASTQLCYACSLAPQPLWVESLE